ncbi:MAG: hypothetical protein ACD_20C00229G0002 [uncultured bacterium]|nr:MAG: hypothetical protein ACD_20C00229G0002 [uncultured bacterium]
MLMPKKTSFKLDQLSYKEKQGLNNFLEHLLLREGGVYVLFGSKPVVFSNLCTSSLEKYKKHYESIPENIKRNANRKKIKLNFYIQDWEKVEKYFKVKEKYLLYFKKYEEIGIADVYLINKANLILVLTEYYSVFKERTKIDFNPITIVDEFNNDSSNFWNLVQNDMLLQGLTFGYGIVNSSLFDQWLKLNETEARNFVNLGFKATDKHLVDKNIKVNYQNFPLPVFKSLPNDSTLEKYKYERKKIKALYRGRNSLKVTLKELCK